MSEKAKRLTVFCSNPQCGDPSMTPGEKSKRVMTYIEQGLVMRYLKSLSFHIFQCPQCHRLKGVSFKWFGSGYTEEELGKGKHLFPLSLFTAAVVLMFFAAFPLNNKWLFLPIVILLGLYLSLKILVITKHPLFVSNKKED